MVLADPSSTSKTYNILLEYGEFDLNEYFLERLQPVFLVDIMHFWNDLFNIAKPSRVPITLNTGRANWQKIIMGKVLDNLFVN